MSPRFWTAVAFASAISGLAAQPHTTIAGRVTRPDGTPAADAPVFAATVRSDGTLRTVAETVSEWDGQYRLAGLAAGRYVIGARLTRQAAPTYYPNELQVDQRRAVAVFDGVPAEGIDIWLHPLPQRHSVTGRVYWPDSRSIRNLAIEYGGPENPRKGIWYVYDPGGLFAIDGVPPGTLVLLARADSDTGPLIGIASTDVSVAPIEDVKVELAPPGSIEGRIVFERPMPSGSRASRVVLSHSLLAVSPLYPAESGAVDGNGRFHIDSARGVYRVVVEGLPPGWSVKRVRRAGRDVPPDRVSVGPAETVTGLELTVGPAAR